MQINELIYQLRSFNDIKCLNKMLNIRLRRDFIKDTEVYNKNKRCHF